MADKRYRVKFQCPNPDCNSTTVEEVTVEVSQFSPILNIYIPFSKQPYCEIFYDDCSHDDGRVLHYACLSCEYILRTEPDDIPITESIELFEWLKQHNMLEEM